MTPKQADKAIAHRQGVTVRSREYNETFTAIFVARDRRTIETSSGGVYDRADLEIIRYEV